LPKKKAGNPVKKACDALMFVTPKEMTYMGQHQVGHEV